MSPRTQPINCGMGTLAGRELGPKSPVSGTLLPIEERTAVIAAATIANSELSRRPTSWVAA
jgi:hypothetical protein